MIEHIGYILLGGVIFGIIGYFIGLAMDCWVIANHIQDYHSGWVNYYQDHNWRENE